MRMSKTRLDSPFAQGLGFRQAQVLSDDHALALAHAVGRVHFRAKVPRTPVDLPCFLGCAFDRRVIRSNHEPQALHGRIGNPAPDLLPDRLLGKAEGFRLFEIECSAA